MQASRAATIDSDSTAPRRASGRDHTSALRAIRAPVLTQKRAPITPRTKRLTAGGEPARSAAPGLWSRSRRGSGREAPEGSPCSPTERGAAHAGGVTSLRPRLDERCGSTLRGHSRDQPLFSHSTARRAARAGRKRVNASRRMVQLAFGGPTPLLKAHRAVHSAGADSLLGRGLARIGSFENGRSFWRSLAFLNPHELRFRGINCVRGSHALPSRGRPPSPGAAPRDLPHGTQHARQPFGGRAARHHARRLRDRQRSAGVRALVLTNAAVTRATGSGSPGTPGSASARAWRSAACRRPAPRTPRPSTELARLRCLRTPA